MLELYLLCCEVVDYINVLGHSCDLMRSTKSETSGIVAKNCDSLLSYVQERVTYFNGVL